MRAWRVVRWLGAWVVGLSAALALMSASAQAAVEYRLGPEDVLRISVWKDETLNQEVVVRPDGMISFPLVGDVLAEGRTVEELKKELAIRLGSYVQEPVLSITVMKVNSYHIFVIGRVNHPGEFVVGRPTDVMQALSLAGGLTPYAAANQIKVLRRERGAETIYPFKYGDVEKGVDLGQNMLLERGDVVVVP